MTPKNVDLMIDHLIKLLRDDYPDVQVIWENGNKPGVYFVHAHSQGRCIDSRYVRDELS